MDTRGFRKYLINATYKHEGKNKNYTKNAINSRINKAVDLERDLGINLDDYVISAEKFTELLKMIRNSKIEKLEHTPKSNAARHYYAYKNDGVQFPRIF